MRTLSTLATLLLGLTVVFWAPAAKAHSPHGNGSTNDHCPGEPPPQGELIQRSLWIVLARSSGKPLAVSPALLLYSHASLFGSMMAAS